MSYVTDLTMIFPNWNDAKFFEEIYRKHTGFSLEPVVSDGGKAPGNAVYTFGLNYVLSRAPELLDILEHTPWTRGTVLYVHHEEDDHPTVTVFGQPSD